MLSTDMPENGRNMDFFFRGTPGNHHSHDESQKCHQLGSGSCGHQLGEPVLNDHLLTETSVCPQQLDTISRAVITCH